MKAPSDLIPHRPPWPVLDRVVSVAGDEVVAEIDAGPDGIAPLLLVDLAAQAAACWVGSTITAGGGVHSGYLVAARGWKFPRFVAAGETARLLVTRRSSLGALSSFAARVLVGDAEAASGELTCARTS